jgi:hypothetical protein
MFLISLEKTRALKVYRAIPIAGNPVDRGCILQYLEGLASSNKSNVGKAGQIHRKPVLMDTEHSCELGCRWIRALVIVIGYERAF